ncbi:hypothetical protein [Mycoplasma sp. VS1572C]
MNISFTICYFISNQNARGIIYVIWVSQLASTVFINNFWRCRAYAYCKKYNLKADMFDEKNRLIKWIVNKCSNWPYSHFTMVYDAFNWKDEYK